MGWLDDISSAQTYILGLEDVTSEGMNPDMKGSILQKLGLHTAKQWTQMKMKQEVFSLVNVSSSDG